MAMPCEGGQRYARSVATRLDEVERDTLDLMSQAGLGEAMGALELAVVPTFATQGLMPEHLIAVAAPSLIKQGLAGQPCESAADVARLPLLQASTRPYAWRQWFKSQGLEVDRDMAGARMELFSMPASSSPSTDT